MAPQKLNPSSSTPLYKQVYTILKSRIANGELKPGDKIPTENELIQEYGVSRITIRAAISELVEDRVLERAQGKGTFVCKPKDAYQADDSHGFTQSCYLSGKIPKTTLLTLEYVLPSPKVQSFLQLRDGAPTLLSRRLRFADNEPILIESNYYAPCLSFLEKEDLSGSLFNILHQHGYSIVTQARSLDVCTANKEEAALLNVKRGSPLLLFTDYQLDGEGKPLFFSKQVYCTERLKFYI